MNSHYNQDYSFNEIKGILAKIKECVAAGKFIISLNENRKENVDFINHYNIRQSRQRDLLMQIEVEDFCHSLQNTKKGYENETLYVFAPWFELRDPFDAKEKVCVYAKFNILDLNDGAKIVVVSFHELNKPIEYLFRKKTQERRKDE